MVRHRGRRRSNIKHFQCSRQIAKRHQMTQNAQKHCSTQKKRKSPLEGTISSRIDKPRGLPFGKKIPGGETIGERLGAQLFGLDVRGENFRRGKTFFKRQYLVATHPTSPKPPLKHPYASGYIGHCACGAVLLGACAYGARL